MSTGPRTSGPQLKSSDAQVILYLDFNNLDFYHGKRGLRPEVSKLPEIYHRFTRDTLKHIYILQCISGKSMVNLW